jgi:lysophospholipase L1-like esterase
MNRCFKFIAASLVLTLLLVDVARSQEKAAEAESLRLTLPPRCFATVGQPFNIYFDNVILTKTPEQYQFRVGVERDGKPSIVGEARERHWTCTPQASDVGAHALRVTVFDRSDRELAKAKSELIVTPADAGTGRKLTLLIVGDSLTHATIYPNELAKLMSQPGNPQWTMLGTHRPDGAAPGVAHEGYGGWTWEAFGSRYYEKPDLAKKQRTSPFVFVDAQGKPQLDPARYFDEKCGGQRPDVVTFLLGINDCFSASPDDPAKLDERIDAVFVHADKLLAAIRKAAPNADLAVCLCPPPNVRQEAFTANYQERYTRWGWKRIQHRLVEREIQHFGNRESDRIFLIPTELNVDPIDGYPNNNAVHPNAVGYRQIAETIYAWLKRRMASTQAAK